MNSQYRALGAIPGGLGLFVGEGDLSPSAPPPRSLRTNNPYLDQMCLCYLTKGSATAGVPWDGPVFHRYHDGAPPLELEAVGGSRSRDAPHFTL